MLLLIQYPILLFHPLRHPLSAIFTLKLHNLFPYPFRLALLKELLFYHLSFHLGIFVFREFVLLSLKKMHIVSHLSTFNEIVWIFVYHLKFLVIEFVHDDFIGIIFLAIGQGEFWDHLSIVICLGIGYKELKRKN